MTLRAVVYALWAALGLYWLLAALRAKKRARTGGARAPGLVVLSGFVLVRLLGGRYLAVHILPVRVVGVALVVGGLGLAVWARIYLGRNWGMPMTQKEEPELVTSGPYQFIRHPIYSGLLLALLGTALATNLYWLFAFALQGAYFIIGARVEERIMTRSFPETYPAYRAATKMLIPFLL